MHPELARLPSSRRIGDIYIRETVPEDIERIKGCLVEEGGEYLNEKVLEAAKKSGRIYTYLKDSRIIACVGIQSLEGEQIQLWALYSNKWPPLTRLRAAKFFIKEIKRLVKSKVYMLISDRLVGGERYAEFLGLRYIGSQPSKLFDCNDKIYEA